MIRRLIAASACALAIATASTPGTTAAQGGAANAPVPAPPVSAPSSRTQAPVAEVKAAQVNLNTATAAELEKLPGVGPAMALRIIEYREKNGAFKKVEDLMNVRGIGEASFLKLKPQILVTPARTAER